MKMKLILAAAVLAFSANGALADFLGGRNAYLDGDYQLAYKEFASTAQTGDAKSQIGLGLLHTWGLGTHSDFTEGYKWFHVAATQNSTVHPVVRVLAKTNRNYLAERMTREAVQRAVEQAWDLVKRDAPSDDESWEDIFVVMPAASKPIVLRAPESAASAGSE